MVHKQCNAIGVYHTLEEHPGASEQCGAINVYHTLEEHPETQEQRNATGIYHTLEEHPEAQEQRNATGVYHILEKHPGTSDEEHPQAREQRTATGVYHTLEEDPETQEQRSAIAVYLVLEEDLQLRIGSQSTCGYRVPKGERGNNPGLFRSPKILKTSTTSVSQRLPGEYNCLDFSGNSVICDRSADDPDKVYSRLKEGTGGQEEKRDIIDNDYSHFSEIQC